MLASPMLLGGDSSVSIEHLSALGQAAGGTSHTFSALSLGAPSAGRVILACVGCRTSADNREITGATLGGVSMTAVVATVKGSGSSKRIMRCFSVVDASNISADLVVTTNQSLIEMTYSLYAIRNLDSATVAQTSTGSSSVSALTPSVVPAAVIG